MKELDYVHKNYSSMTSEMYRGIEEERHRMNESRKLLKQCEKFVESTTYLYFETKDLRELCDHLQKQLEEERQMRKEMELKLQEMSQLSSDIARKSSDEAVLKTLRTYVSRSKHKTADKRIFAKTAMLEIVAVNGLSLPKDLKEAIESLDDEMLEPKRVTVNGNYNDVHDNEKVNCVAAEQRASA